MRKSDTLFTLFGIGSLLLVTTLMDARLRGEESQRRLDELGRVVAQLELTDLSLFTEARYTRHLSQADLHTPFQEHPLAIEHFPSGSLVGPPTHLTGPHASVPPQTAIPD